MVSDLVTKKKASLQDTTLSYSIKNFFFSMRDIIIKKLLEERE